MVISTRGGAHCMSQSSFAQIKFSLFNFEFEYELREEIFESI